MQFGYIVLVMWHMMLYGIFSAFITNWIIKREKNNGNSESNCFVAFGIIIAVIAVILGIFYLFYSIWLNSNQSGGYSDLGTALGDAIIKDMIVIPSLFALLFLIAGDIISGVADKIIRTFKERKQS